METGIIEEEDHWRNKSTLVSKNVGSPVKIKSISIDLVSANDKCDAGKCEHFSIRRYVSEIRMKDRKICWPFASDNIRNNSAEKTCMLPPLHVPKFRWWRCQNCLNEIGGEVSEKEIGTDINRSNGICCCISSHNDASMILLNCHQGQEVDIVEGQNVYATTLANVSDNECHHSLCNDQIEKNEVIPNTITVLDHSDYDVNRESPRLQVMPDKICLMEEKQTNSTVSLKSKCNGSFKVCGHEGQETANIELYVRNSKSRVKDSTEMCHSGRENSMDAQRIEDQCHGKPSVPHRRKAQKVRLLTELLHANGNANTAQIGTKDYPSNAISNASDEIDRLSVPKLQADLQRSANKGLVSQKGKRKFTQDEEWKAPGVTSPNNLKKKIPIHQENAETTIETAVSELKRDAYTGIGQIGQIQTGTNSLLTKDRIDRNPTIGGKKRSKKTQVADRCFLFATSNENMPNGCQGKNRDAIEGNATDSILLSSVQNELADRRPTQRLTRKSGLCKKKSKMPQVDDGEASENPWNTGMPREDLMTRKDEVHAGLLNGPIYSGENASSEKGLNFFPHSYYAQRYDKKYLPQVEYGQASVMNLQEGTVKEDRLTRKDAETKHGESSRSLSKSAPNALHPKGVRSDPRKNGKETICRMPFLNEKKIYTSQIENVGHSMIQKMDISGSNTDKTIEVKEQSSSVTMKLTDQRAKQMSKDGSLDDIPMEIVELMAKNQYERCLHDAKDNKRLLETIHNARNGEMIDFTKIYRNKEVRSLKEESTHKRKLQAKNGKDIIMTEDHVGPSKQSFVDFLPHMNRRQFHTSQLEKPPFTGFSALPQCLEEPTSGVHFPASSSSRHSRAQNCKHNGDILGLRPSPSSLKGLAACNICLWPSTMPNHISFGYSNSPNCMGQSTNTDKLLNQNTMNLEKHDRNFGSEALSRTHQDYPLSCKHNGNELRQKTMVSVDQYPNETIPAMHLLSLMDAGVRSGLPVNTSVTPAMLKKPFVPLDYQSKQFPGRGNGAYKTGHTIKTPPYDYCGKDDLTNSSHECLPAAPSVSASFLQHDRIFRMPPDYTGLPLKYQQKGKKKCYDSPTLNRSHGSQKSVSTSGDVVQHSGAMTVQSTKKVPLGASDSVLVPFQGHTNENMMRKAYTTNGALLRNNSEMEICSVNRNPADFSIPQAENVFMIRGEDLRFRNRNLYTDRSVLDERKRRQKNTKPPAVRGRGRGRGRIP